MSDEGDLPAQCTSSTGDGFSGWFAIRDQRQCNDFCYWHVVAEDGGGLIFGYTSRNTADPHETTVIIDESTGEGIAYWMCIYDVADSELSLWEHVSEKWVESSGKDKFPHLRCQRGAGEYLTTRGGDVVLSQAMWVTFVVLVPIVYFAVALLWFARCRQHSPGAPQIPPVAGNPLWRWNAPLSPAASRRLRQLSRLCGMFLLQILLLFAIVVSSLSYVEIHDEKYPGTNLRAMLTPICSNPDHVCKPANSDLNQASNQRTALSTPFSYLVASDPQLYWFHGEFAELGTSDLPKDCSPWDSCDECTEKVGYNSNLRLGMALEALMTGQVNGMEHRQPQNQTMELDLPIPHTLVMNGDLTSYFHPPEKKAYDQLFSTLQGLQNYFPGLGNHDLQHTGGGNYGADQWISGPSNCNAANAIGYLRSGFCGMIPNFNPDRIVRYHASSMAYSWDEGHYHFVQLHYYPTYEMASLEMGSSLRWLQQDLTLANEANLSSILFVHASQGLYPAMEHVILDKNVKAIIAGHSHRCLQKKCEGVYPMNEEEVQRQLLSQSLQSQSTSQSQSLQSESTSQSQSSLLDAQKCLPAAYDTCHALTGQHLFHVQSNTSFPHTPMISYPRAGRCSSKSLTYVNKTDNSLLCKRILYNRPYFPYVTEEAQERIPIFWSGSSTFETFLKVDFYDDRIVINAMTVLEKEDLTVARYIDVHNVPNARYPYHDTMDMEEVVIFL